MPMLKFFTACIGGLGEDCDGVEFLAILLVTGFMD